jgi:hypothetical protein
MITQVSIRRRVIYTLLYGSVVATAVWPQSWALADPPDTLREYRFITDHSTVQVTGGIAGIDWTLNIFGKFGLVTGYNYDTGGPTAHAPTLVPFAAFTDVHATLFDPRRASPQPSPGWDLDKTLNLSGLTGTFAVPSQLHFSGVDGGGQPIKLEATLAGSLLHLTGATDPGCCDFFSYKIDAYAHLTPWADFNFDGRVDGADYTIWRKQFESSITAGASGDANGDGIVDAMDLALWREQFGQIDVSSGVAQTAVPEPATLLLLLAGTLPVVVRRHWTV